MILAQTLRDTILQAAMQGKLTEQLSSDSSADDMFRLIEAEKANGIKSKKIKRDNSCSIKKYNPLEDGIFEIPSSWRWVKLGELCQKIGAGSTPSGGSKVYVSEGVKFLREQNVRNEGISYEGIVYIPKEIHSLMDGSKVMAKDILLNITGASIGRNSLVPDDFDTANVNQHVLVIRFIDERLRLYIHLCLQAPFVYNQMMSEQKGDKPGLSATRVSNFLIPLPPIEEQQRIVDRVNELLAKVDEFEKIENRLTVVKEKFPSDLRAAILQAAMQGKLTEQLDTDSSVDAAITNLASEKKAIGVGKGGKQAAICDEEVPYELPSSWRWIRLSDVVYNRGQKTPTDTFSYIDIGSIDNVHQKLNKNETIIEAGSAPSRARKIVKQGDVLYATVRPYLHNMCIIDREFSHEPIASTGFAVMVCHSCLLNKYLLYYLLSPAFDSYANATNNAKGVAYPAINDKKLYAGLIPLPPIEEQQRIVERLDALLPLCDDLASE